MKQRKMTKMASRNLAFRGDEEEEDDVVEEDRGALGPFWLLALLEVEEDDKGAMVERARWFSAPLFLEEEGENRGKKGVAAARGGRGNPRAQGCGFIGGACRELGWLPRWPCVLLLCFTVRGMW